MYDLHVNLPNVRIWLTLHKRDAHQNIGSMIAFLLSLGLHKLRKCLAKLCFIYHFDDVKYVHFVPFRFSLSRLLYCPLIVYSCDDIIS